MVNRTGRASFTKGCCDNSPTTSTGTLLKNRSETLFSNTTICESLCRMRSNIFTAPPNKPTTLNIVATPSAMPAAPMDVRTRWRRRLVMIILQRLMIVRVQLAAEDTLGSIAISGLVGKVTRNGASMPQRSGGPGSAA